MTELSLDSLRLEAKRLHRAYIAHEVWALQRLQQHPPRRAPDTLRRADFLHVIAQENGFPSWPRLKLAAETTGLDRAAKLQRLKIALFHGQTPAVEALLADTPDLADGVFGLECALYRREAVAAALARDPGLATRPLGPRTPILHLAFSRWFKAHPELEDDMLAVADLLLAHGADVNDGYPAAEGEDHLLSALYGAIGHADNMVLGRWLLDHGANPNDNESLYHATELGHHEGLRMLLEAGADPHGTNALLRAMDFHDHAAVEMLLAHGARPDDFNPDEVGGEAPWVVPALHQAARRGCDRRMVDLLLGAGADPARTWQGPRPMPMPGCMATMLSRRRSRRAVPRPRSAARKPCWPAPPRGRTARASTSTRHAWPRPMPTSCVRRCTCRTGCRCWKGWWRWVCPGTCRTEWA
ncbi:hypothetical protein KU6B_44400 [Mameliella alba]|uniref:ankyrin repeat domain-containing protein n=1 Tax=Mameliella alba TaxID=561184 RepID=UPI0013E4350C|nr:ankyrin repeat domain-containing protein [Mameliella alba]BBU58175.1 hypothetical protein KU6B_44400 [Mameliella alba]